jgi:hypothetical protein
MLDFASQLGAIPEDRRDLLAALKDRQNEVQELGERLRRFDRQLERRRDGLQATPSALVFLKDQLPELPASARLHALIASVAVELKDEETAARHAALAAFFDQDVESIPTTPSGFLPALSVT